MAVIYSRKLKLETVQHYLPYAVRVASSRVLNIRWYFAVWMCLVQK